ncbi:MAG: hypothetical protein CMM20_05740 [Rhodospirillaceae bacterium]|nr:hypothetical protein [Rhodospirillaceae bacterium]PPR64946.1 MAG: hypothetical protein CFH08_01066 [Alphaproteobacteria bacterium MarineAlpha3_Bin7]
MYSLLKQIFKYARVYQKIWIAPIILVMLLIGVLLILAESSAIAPFIYAIF